MVIVVALLAEGVDRNVLGYKGYVQLALSPSSRRAWIEIINIKPMHNAINQSPSSRRAWIEIDGLWNDIELDYVALLAEGVDRNSKADILLS